VCWILDLEFVGPNRYWTYQNLYRITLTRSSLDNICHLECWGQNARRRACTGPTQSLGISISFKDLITEYPWRALTKCDKCINENEGKDTPDQVSVMLRRRKLYEECSDANFHQCYREEICELCCKIKLQCSLQALRSEISEDIEVVTTCARLNWQYDNDPAHKWEKLLVISIPISKYHFKEFLPLLLIPSNRPSQWSQPFWFVPTILGAQQRGRCS